MTGKMIAVIVGVVVVVGAGIALVLSDDPTSDPPVAGDRPVPFQDDNVGSSLPGEGSTTPSGSQPVDTAPSATDGGPTESGASLPQEPMEINLTAYELVVALATVDGLGPGVAYAWGAPGFDYAAIGTVMLSDEAFLEQITSVEQASCLLLSGAVLVIDDSGIGLGPNTAFTAGFRASQTEFLSIGDNGEGIVTGGYYTGDGTREGSQQWPIFRDGSLDWTAEIIHDVRDDPYANPAFWDPRFDGIVVSAEWRGVSDDDFSDETAEGAVKVVCVFAER